MSSSPKLGVGRPRALATSTTLSPREQVLDAAAALFVQHGFAATTTRAIADRVGIRQASLYYHFAGKDDILLELLGRTVRPTLALSQTLMEDRSLSPAAALYALAVHDVDALRAAPHNIGTLYLLPEIAHERYDAFRADRTQLRDVYGYWGIAAASEDVRAVSNKTTLGALLIHLVELVISMRREKISVVPTQIAAACLRVCGLSSSQIDEAVRCGHAWLPPTPTIKESGVGDNVT